MRAAIITSFLLTYALLGWCQPAEEFKALKAKYSDQPAVYQERSESVEINYSKKEGLVFNIDEREQLMVLAANALPFAPGVEYFNKSYTIEKIKAYTLIPEKDGYRQMEVKDFKKTSEISDGVFFDDQQAFKFTYPAVCQGAKLVEETTFKNTKLEYPMSFTFGVSLPTVLARFSITFPENVTIRYKLFGADTTKISLTKTKKGKKWIYVWEANNMNAIHSEPNAPDHKYYFPHVIGNVASYTVNKEVIPVIGSLSDFYKINYSKISGVNKDASPEIKLLADSITHGIVDESEKVTRIFEWVQKNIRYVAIEDGDNGVVPREASLVLHRRYGDCKDKTSIIHALLTSIGADASFAWIGTRDLPYKYSEFPSTYVDNHMIAVYRNPNGKTQFLDGTALYHTAYLPPYGIQGKECLIERGPEKFDLLTVPVSSPETNAIIDSTWVEVRHDTLIGYGYAYFCGESKSHVIASFLNSSKEDYSTVFSRLLPKATNKFKVTKIEVSDLTKIADTLKVKYSFEFPSYISLRGDKYYINLNIDRKFQDETVKPNRTVPIELDVPVRYTSVCSISPLAGYAEPFIPEPSSFSDSRFEFNISYKVDKDFITLTKVITSAETLLHKESFDSYRNFLSNLNEAYMQTLVFRKN